MEEKTTENKRHVIIRKIADEYQIEIPNQPGIENHPTGFCYSLQDFYRQVEHLQKTGFEIREDKKHPVSLERRV